MKLNIKLFILLLVILLVQLCILYRQTQIQRSLMGTNSSICKLLLDGKQREQEYYDIMKTLDNRVKMEDIIIKGVSE